jgi:hypothetical protein
MKMRPIHQGSTCRTLPTIDHPATLSRQPRGTAMVTLAHRPNRFVRPQAGSE